MQFFDAADSANTASDVAKSRKTPRVESVRPLAPIFHLATCALLIGAGAAVPGRAAEGVVVFENHCAPCHGLDGKARTPAGRKLGAKDLSESKLADEAIAHQIREGAKSPQGAERMPAFKQKLNAAEVAAVAEYVKTFRKK